MTTRAREGFPGHKLPVTRKCSSSCIDPAKVSLESYTQDLEEHNSQSLENDHTANKNGFSLVTAARGLKGNVVRSELILWCLGSGLVVLK